jgi:pimeloyl-ACP methyl ester carboxylesterase
MWARGLFRAALSAVFTCCIAGAWCTTAQAAKSPATATTPGSAPPRSPMAGTWEGKLAGRIHLILHLTADSSGALSGTMDSPDQGAMGLPIDWISVSGDSIKYTMKQIGGSYAGAINARHSEIDGIWRQGAAVLPLAFHPPEPAVAGAAGATKTDAGSNRPQEPKPPFPYDAVDVLYANPAAKGVRLAGTLTTPHGTGPFPCAILITGSGPEDRDEAIFGHKPFLVLADYLTRHGIAVLRSDDRGVGASSGSTEGATSEDFASDVRAAMGYLKKRKEIDPTKIGLIGHSEGGLIAPMVAAREKSVAFVVLLAGPGMPGDSILVTQSKLISLSLGLDDSTSTYAAAAQRDLLVAAEQSPDSAQLVAKLKVIIRAQIERLPEDQRSSVADLDEIAAGQAKLLKAPWMRFFLSYDPRPTLSQLQCPVLALNGEKDIQVAAEQNLPEIRAALKKGGNKDATVESIPNLNHLFQTAETGAISEYAQTKETFAPVALEKISDWIGARMGRGK